MLRRSLKSRAFTLIEIIVVATLISLLSGIALFSINEMYIRNIRKVSFAEAFQLATALSIAENDLNFYPRLNYLRQSKDLVLVDPASILTPPVPATESDFNESTDPTSSVPGLDYWGFLRFNNPNVLRIKANWNGPYMGASQARQDSNRGASSGFVKMRLPELAQHGDTVNGNDISIVQWPADPFGNPYLLYQLKTQIVSGANIPFFIEKPNDDANYKNMIVSYGRNKVPGGDDRTSQVFGQTVLLPGALYLEGDSYGSGDDKADFTLRVYDRRAMAGPARSSADVTADNALMAAIETKDPNLLLKNDSAAVLGADTTSPHFQVLRSLDLEAAEALLPGSYDPAVGQVGVINDGSDDIILEF